MPTNVLHASEERFIQANLNLIIKLNKLYAAGRSLNGISQTEPITREDMVVGK